MTSKRLLEQLYIASKIGITSKENEKILKDYYKVVLKDLEVLEWLKKSIISKKRIQSLRETANPVYEIILHIPQNILKEVLQDD